MESNYSNRDFEQFVKQNADEYRMFPSEKVWNGVHNALHTRPQMDWIRPGIPVIVDRRCSELGHDHVSRF
jgi:hypothetical protein